MDGNHVEQPEMQLEEQKPDWARLLLMAGSIAFLVWETADLIAKGYPPATGDSARFLIVLFVCGFLVLSSLFESNLRWIIRSHEIQIDESWIYDRHQVQWIRPGDITKITIASVSDEGPDLFYIRIWLTSGQDVQSPCLRDGQRANELKVEIARRLGVANA